MEQSTKNQGSQSQFLAKNLKCKIKEPEKTTRVKDTITTTTRAVMAAKNSSNSLLFPVNSPCLFDKKVFDQYCLIPALIIITIFAFLNKRVRIRPKVCDGRPGLVLPINFLGDNTNNRLSIAVAFGVIAGSCFHLFNDITHFIPSSYSDATLSGLGSWNTAFRSIVWVLLYGVVNFPIFACLMTEHLLVGAVFGFLYTLMKLIAVMVLLLSCPSPYIQTVQKIKLNPVFKRPELFQLLPDLLCYLFLLGRFALLLIRELLRRYRGPEIRNIQEPIPIPVIAKAHDYIHVRLLLGNKLDERLDPSRQWYIKLRDWFYRPREDFKFSTVIVATLTVSVIFIYQMAVSWVVQGAILEQALSPYREAVERLQHYTIESILFNLFDIVGVSFDVSACFSAFLMTLVLLHFLKCHRQHVLNSYKARKRLGNSPSRLVGRSLSYPGYQIAYVGFGYIVLAVILMIISISLGLIIKLNLWDTVLHLIEKISPILVVVACVWIFQLLLGWLVFRDRRFPDRTISINNHRLYCVMSFFFFFFNILVGFFSSSFRLLKSMFLGIIFFSRIDRTPLMLGFHKWDFGYMSYIGFLNVLKSYSHPVMLVFCQLLLDLRQAGSRHPLGNEAFVGNTDNQHLIAHYSDNQPCRVSKTACNRWLVAYTLIKNPGLRDSRKQNLRVYFLNDVGEDSTVGTTSLVIN